MSLASLAQRIEKAALSCGLDQCGIIPVDDLMGFGTRLEERMEKAPASAGFYGNMARLGDIKSKYPWGKSIVVCTFDYSRYRYPRELQGRYGKSFFLSPEPGGTAGYDLTRFEKFLTEAGIRWEGGNHVGHGGVGPLRYEAVKAGLGIIRKNNFFYTENGSYVSLFSYLIDQPCTLIHHPNIPPCAESCTLCQRACKTKALCAPYTLNPGNCVSFLTTFGKGNIPEHLDEGMLEEWICGCDNCQDACPHNRRHNWNAGDSFSDLEALAPRLTPEALLEQSDAFLSQHVIPKTDLHLQPEDMDVLRHNARRALRFRDKQ